MLNFYETPQVTVCQESICNVQEFFHSTNAFNVISLLSQVEKDDLIIFDVDEVLIVPQDPILRPIAIDYCELLFDEVFGSLSTSEEIDFFGCWISQIKFESVDSLFVNFIQKLKNHGYYYIALTNLLPGAGSCGQISSMEEFRYNQLIDIGIDFQGNFHFHFLDLKLPKKQGRTSAFDKGIIYARPYSKGEALCAFLKESQFRPKKVWFVDNDEEQIQIVAASMAKYHIPFVGIHYLDEKFAKESFDLELGKFQIEYFYKTKIWLDTASAKEIKKRFKK